MNYTKPADGPSLLSMVDVRKLFHELGHLHHTLCTRVEHASQSYVDRDFVEAPSIMFEQFLWTPRHIKDTSLHYSHLSPELKAAWLDSKHSDSGEEPPPQPPAQL